MNSQTSSSPCFLITTLAMYQTEFWADIGDALRKKGRAVAYISFDDRSTELLIKRGFQVFALTNSDLESIDASPEAFDISMENYGITNINHWLSHEKITFDVSDTRLLQRKLLAYLGLVSGACQALLKDGPVTMVQELGGFVSVVASFFAARHAGVDNWFIEPSFFRGRMLFLKNSFDALSVPSRPAVEVCQEVKDYLQSTLEKRSIVIPLKDKHQYTSAFRKVINMHNAKRLVQKLIDKHLMGKHQEFGHIGSHVLRHAKMLFNSFGLRHSYTPLKSLGTFIYYPLHVPADMALTIRSPEYLDQLALIDYMARSIPHTHKLAIKEHPAMIGAVDAKRLKALLARFDNIALIAPTTNNYEVLQACDAVVSVNSKSGAEALLLGKQVFVLGEAFYRDSPLVIRIDSIRDLPGILKSRLGQNVSLSKNEIEQYFEQVWRCSYPGELYIQDKRNIETFTNSMIQAIAM